MDGPVSFLRFGEGTLGTYGPGSTRIVNSLTRFTQRVLTHRLKRRQLQQAPSGSPSCLQAVPPTIGNIQFPIAFQLTSAYFSLLQRTLAYFSLLQLTLAYFSLLQLALAYFSLLQLTLAYFSLLQLTLAYFSSLQLTLVYFSLLQFTLVYFSVLQIT